MKQEIYLAVFTSFFPLLSFLYLKFRKFRTHNLIFVFISFSLFIDSCNCYLSDRRINNLFLINFYDYAAIFLEISFLISTSKFSKTFRRISWVVIVLYWIAHAVFNYHNGFLVTSAALSFILSFVVCTFAAIAALRILNDKLDEFNKLKFLLIPIFGFFVFEASCLIPVCTVNLILTKEEDTFLSDLYNHVIVIGTILRNLLFTIYFVIERNNQRVSSNLIH